MKKFFSKTVFAVAAIAAGLSSCSHDNNFYNPDNAFKTQEELYNKAFAEQFGTPAEGHDWGFGNGSRAAVSRGANTNANEWGGYIEVPAPLTQAQIDVVTNWFATHQNPEGVAVNYKEYFAQQVSSTENGRHMDQLRDAIDHVNNFNNGDCSTNNNVWDGTLSDPSNENSKVFHSDKIMLMTNQNTESFSYHETVSQKWWNDHYVIIPGDKIDPIVAGMYFVGFDYEANKDESDNDDVARDYYFNDWIIKITPGLYKDAQRVIAEDLGAVGDFDFNDVVFDVRVCSPYYQPYTLITVRAAGGTMPLYIEGQEVHELFGVDTKTMVNTGATSCPVAQFTIDGVKEAKDIKITIDNGEITFNLENGDAPKKICVGADYNWCTERQNIKAKYPNYVKYVADPEYKDWYK